MGRLVNRAGRRAAGGDRFRALDALAGRRIPGGCDDCDAYQEMTTDGGGVYVVTVRHDASCPWLRAHERNTR